MKYSCFSVISAALSLLLSACSGGGSMEGVQVNKANESVVMKSTELKPLPADGEYAPDDEMMFDVSVSLDSLVPGSLADSAACAQINKYIVAKLLSQPSYLSVREAISGYIEAKKKGFKDEEYLMTCYDHITGTADVGLEGILNYTFREDYYGGGAHPTQLVTIQRFDLSDGRPIGLWDVFADSCSNTLKNMLTQKLMDAEQVSTIEELREKGFLEMVDMFLPQNFWLDKDSISFFFNQYDIAPYAMGQTSLSFKYKEIMPYLKEWVRERSDE